MTLEHYLRRRRIYETIAIVAITMLFGLVSATSLIIENVRDGFPSLWQRALATELTATLSVALLVPPLVWFLNRLALSWSNIRWRILWHFPVFVCFSLAHIALFVMARKLLWPLAGDTYSFGPLGLGLIYEMRKGLLIYIGLVLMIQSYQFILDRLQGEAGAVDTEDGSQTRYSDQFLVRMLDKQYLIKADSIDWIQSASNYVLLHCAGRSYPMRQTLSGLYQQLDPQMFVRVHRTAIVNLTRVKALQDSGELQVELEQGTVVAVSRTFLPELKQALWHDSTGPVHP